MKALSILVLTRSGGYARHVGSSLPDTCTVETSSDPAAPVKGHDLVLVHAGSLTGDTETALQTVAAARVPVAVAADVPDLDHMLSLSRHDIRGYFNSWMADVHYRQMIELLASGLTWFSPPMMSGALELARRSREQTDPAQPCESVLKDLTRREREIASDVASGMSNREIAEQRHITERTVKSHLTRIFRKLGTRNRHALSVKLRGA